MTIIKKKIRMVLEAIVLWLERRLGCVYWLHIGDILFPCDGMMTASQYCIASRILDVENIDSGADPIWQNRLSEAVYGRLSKEQEKNSNHKFIRLVKSLDRRGFSPGTGRMAISDNPICLNNGTHRIAYMAVKQPNMFLPFVREIHDLLPAFPLDGEKYWRENGLHREELLVLKERYQRAISEEVRTSIFAYIKKAYFREAVGNLKEYGEITSVCEIEMEQVEYTCFTWRLFKQRLYTKGRLIRSVYIDRVSEELTRKFNSDWGYLAHSVSESIDTENMLEEAMELQFEWVKY